MPISMRIFIIARKRPWVPSKGLMLSRSFGSVSSVWILCCTSTLPSCNTF